MQDAIKTIDAIREQIESGADPGVISSALNRLQNQLGRMAGSENQPTKPTPNKLSPAEAFFARKKKKEGNWENPLREYKLRR